MAKEVIHDHYSNHHIKYHRQISLPDAMHNVNFMFGFFPCLLYSAE